MPRDIDEALRGWPYDANADEVSAREVRARDGRTVLQIRIDLGMLQMEVDGRPDGSRPGGFGTFLDYLRHRARRSRRRRKPEFAGIPAAWAMGVDHCAEADRELVQYYHRRVAFLALQDYGRALRDAEHSLALIDFIAEHGPSIDYVARHEQLRGGVLFDRTQAAAAIALEDGRPDGAIEAIREGIERLEHHQDELNELGEPDDFPGRDPAEDSSDALLVERLHRLESEIRAHFEVPKSLNEQLSEAVESEDYERAARLRDQIRSTERRR